MKAQKCKSRVSGLSLIKHVVATISLILISLSLFAQDEIGRAHV